jgi:queuine/archaeosine tRNA-ribosyltransferase
MKRLREIRTGERVLQLPVYFPSVSSVKTGLSIFEYISILCALQTKQFLISAYDLHYADADQQHKVRELIAESVRNGATVLMDSGNYESYWHDKKEVWLQTDYHRVLTENSCSFAFGFDEQVPPADFMSHVRLICERQKQDQAVKDKTTIVPIIHGKAEMIPQLCSKVVEEIGIKMLAVPERCLGKGVFARARKVVEIRTALNATGKYVALHLLGTGNPMSLAIYTLAGADSFDGLEWCQTVVDHETATLFHLSHADFFIKQTAWGDMAIDFNPRTLAHNLDFYRMWMERLSQYVHAGEGVEFCKRHFPNRIYSVCEDALGWKP